MKTNSLLSFLLATACLTAEEGMWPFNMIPVKHIEETYKISLDQSWIEHVQKSCLRVSAGGSASFVSPYGLVMTNHHVGGSAIYDLSTQDKDYIEHGFYAQSLEEEVRCSNLYVDQLISIRDVTDEVNREATADKPATEREKARLAAKAAIKKKVQDETGLQPEIISLYHGARYHLYLYKRYTDVRLVMAPEKGIASFGGDEDNFEYPRYALDVCFFRVYENGKPLRSENYLKWSAAGPQGEEGLFVVGHPGRTERMFTSDHLEFIQEVELPLFLMGLNDRKKTLLTFSQKSEENKRIAVDISASVDNSRKAFTGIYEGFKTLPVASNKIAYEKSLYGSVDATQYQPWERLKIALADIKPLYPSYYVLEGRGSRYCKLYYWARDLVRYSEEKAKPNEMRLKEYAETELPALQLHLFSTAPVYNNLEESLLADGFRRMEKILGKDHSVVVLALAGKTPEERAKEIISCTKLGDLQYRKDLFDDPYAVQKSNDPLILLAKMIDPYARDLRQQYEDKFECIKNESYAEIAKIVFDRYGETVYPDATFTLRLAMGRMKGYQEEGAYLAPTTNFGGAFAHARSHGSIEPFRLPPTWMSKEKVLNPNTPFDFVLTDDVIGGNSGSPIINEKAEVVGIIFDGNIQSLIWDYEFDETQGRSIGVHSLGITEALKNVYGAQPLVNEILISAPPQETSGVAIFSTLFDSIGQLFHKR